MLSRLSALLRRPAPAPAPAEPVYLIGDVHGCADLMLSLLATIDDDIAATGARKPPKLVFLGDYVDRGEASATVLDELIALERGVPGRVICW